MIVYSRNSFLLSLPLTIADKQTSPNDQGHYRHDRKNVYLTSDEMIGVF